MLKTLSLFASRLRKLQDKREESRVDALLISKPENVRYLCGFTGTNGQLLITAEKAILITDSRYLFSARKQIPEVIEIYDQKHGIGKFFSSFKRIGFESHALSYGRVMKLKRYLRESRLKAIGFLTEEMRQIKDAGEIRILRQACRITARVFREWVKKIKIGMSEDELEWELLKLIRQKGGDGFAFPPIIAFGKDTADVHHLKGPARLKKGQSALLDFGIDFKGYKTDVTRMIFTQRPTELEQKIYSIVRQANETAIKSIRPGKPLHLIDRAARRVIVKKGYGEFFGHATGHGVGLEIHELPTVSETKTRKAKRVRLGMVFTIEPGIYIAGTGGVRIEDMVYVNEAGETEVLTKGIGKTMKVLSL